MKEQKAFTVHIVDNKTHEDRTIHTDAIIAGFEEKDGACTLVQTKGNFVDVCVACAKALDAVEYVFKRVPQVRNAVITVRAKEKKKKEGESDEQK